MLHGRDDELAMIDKLLADARSGAGGALVVRGEPGIGKTSLLDHAAARATGFRVLRGSGVESESALPFAGLHLLLRPVLDHLDAVPGPQRVALAGAFGLGDGGGDRFMIGAGLLALLADAAERTPLLCVVDDAQWLDRASTDALLFAARRLGQDSVVLLFAVRDYADALASTGLPELVLGGLTVDAATALLAARARTLPAGLRARLIAETRGNPLALVELPATMSAHAASPLPLTSRVLDAFHHQVRSLPASTRTFLLTAAADDSGELDVLLRAAADQGIDLADLAPAEECALVALVDGTLVFRHPLVRAAVYHGAPLGQRLAAHRSLADAYDPLRDADRRAWHLAAAAAGPDESVAEALAVAAGRASARGAHAEAAAGFDRAAQLTPDRAAAVGRRTLACEAAVRDGQPDWAATRARRALPDVSDPALRVRLTTVLARADVVNTDYRHAHELFTANAKELAAHDPTAAFWTLTEALHAAWSAPDLVERTIAEFDQIGLPPDDPLRSVDHLIRWAALHLLDRDPVGLPPLDDTLDRARAVAGADGLVEVASRALMVGRDDVAAALADLVVADARDRGTTVPLPDGLGLQTLTSTFLGRPRDARVSGVEGLRLAQDAGHPSWIAYAAAVLAYAAATEGDEDACRSNAALVQPGASAASTAWAQAALALLDLGHGRAGDAFDRLGKAMTGPTRFQVATVRSVPDYVEAAVRLGRGAEVAEPLARYSRWVGRMGQPWLNASLARCTALLTDSPAAYLAALADPRPLGRARSALVHGEWLRRSRRKSEARAPLTEALRTFEDLSSTPWANRARAELAASGAAVPEARAPDALATLTPQELQIARLAATGLGNREIAAQLYLSPRTIAHHLYKAYPKLGITSRGELAALIQPGGTGPSGTTPSRPRS
ncbi:MAG: AAA family ATPase [Umezawaea sp.]